MGIRPAELVALVCLTHALSAVSAPRRDQTLCWLVETQQHGALVSPYRVGEETTRPRRAEAGVDGRPQEGCTQQAGARPRERGLRRGRWGVFESRPGRGRPCAGGGRGALRG